MYVTPAQLADGADALNELAELYQIDPPLLAATIAAGDRSRWTPEEIASADAALDSIVRFTLQAGGEIDARLAQRGYPLPQDPAQFPVLAVWGRAIARYHLHRQRDRTNEETGRIERDYRDAIRALDAVVAGKLSLGAGDPLAPTPPSDPDGGAVRFSSQPRIFSRDKLEGL
ncbi:phage protein Gp36 family protein [Vulcaniibacterium tengchongense]|uniref:Uncharacterized protein DUF1320 n=1 Tax=Vulcaniibacterium tengchongense TaxID=1273429 RepID=A0A3N4VJG6_9GAMM|nr:phage protein Gp36 family protein [Vulcaniibacterium tengchongense]RPE81843.1 uncharacterized protein DUF1320 [Vulcaniibacterium tengchongense]